MLYEPHLYANNTWQNKDLARVRKLTKQFILLIRNLRATSDNPANYPIFRTKGLCSYKEATSTVRYNHTRFRAKRTASYPAEKLRDCISKI